MRIGACIVVGEETAVDMMMALLEREARSLWSNINNAAMKTFVELSANHLTEYRQEKERYQDLLTNRFNLFKEEADACGVKYYPYQAGFFVALACRNNEVRDCLHKALINEHIYLVTVEKGLRLAICGLPLKKIKGLANKIKEISLKI